MRDDDTEVDPSRPWVKTSDGTVFFGLDAIGGFEADDGTYIRAEDIVASSERALDLGSAGRKPS